MEKAKKIIILEKVLRLMAKTLLVKYKPLIVGITGSVGKTSSKEAVFAVLSKKFRVRKNEKNYNNEIGIPLTVLGVETGGKSIFKWVIIFLKWLGMMIFPIKYPKILILEMGADRPGDIQYLTEFIKPKISIITNISESHLEFFGNIEGVLKEKSFLVKSLPANGLAVLNGDDEQLLKTKKQLKIRSLSFGFSEDSDLRAEEIFYNYENKLIKGISFKLNYKGTNLPVRLNNILAKHQIYAALSAVAVGIELGMNLLEIAFALENFSSPVGRMNLIFGIKNSLLIDDTYNSSPVSALAALTVFGEIESKRKIVVLGDMLELGAEMEEGHRKVARKFLEIKGDIFIGVGSRMKLAIDELRKKGFPEDKMIHFRNSLEAGKCLQRFLRPDDLVLVKGSQGTRMEKILEEVMLHPEEAEKLIPRQNKDWKKVPVRDV